MKSGKEFSVFGFQFSEEKKGLLLETENSKLKTENWFIVQRSSFRVPRFKRRFEDC
jgi:hypothetical protein